MPVHVMSQLLLDLVDGFTGLSVLSWLCLSVVGVLLGLRLWSSSRTAPRVPSAVARNLQGKLILMTGAFTPHGYTLLTRLARQGARIVALTDSPVSARDHQLLHLATVASENNELFIETCNLASLKDIKRFCAEWEGKAATRRGALGEEIGRQHLDSIIFMPDESKKDAELLEFVKQLTPSIVKPTAVPGAPASAKATRIIYVLPSSFYAAADNQDAPPDSATWRDAQRSLQTASRFLEYGRRREAAAKSTDARLAIVALSLGTTRQFLLSLLRPDPRERLLVKLLPWSLITLLYPLIWAIGKSGTEAARAVEWAVLAPLQDAAVPKADKVKVALVRPGVLYRSTIDAGAFLNSITDSALAKKMFEQDEGRIEQKLEQEAKL